MRTARGLPFAATAYMKLIIEGVIARVQRDHKVDLIALAFMANHAHILIRALDRDQCKRFYGEVQKQLTEAVKRLLGREHLNLWRPNGTSVVRYGDLASVLRRIAYAFANPARANLVDSVEQYPGVTSYQSYKSAPATLNAETTQECPWIQLPMIPRLPSLSVTERQDLHLVGVMRARSKERHDLSFRPHAWMEVFGITSDQEVRQARDEVLRLLEEFEREAREKRAAQGWRVKGAKRLRAEPINLSYVPPRSVRIFVYAVDRDTRIRMIAQFKEFCQRCRECYEAWKRGDYRVEWPPGAFEPARPVQFNWLASAV
jgi:hypothetical protein